MVNSGAQGAAPAVMSQRLCDLLLQFPAAASNGVPWRTLRRKYEERYNTAIDIAKLGYDSAITAVTMLLWDVVRLVDSDDTANPKLGIEDGVALTAHPGRMGSWPSLYQALCHVVQTSGSWDSHEEIAGVQVQGVLLSQVKPLLQSHWHSSFEESGLGYLNDEGSFVKMKKMKHLIVAVLKWRNDRVQRQRMQTAKLTPIDEALLPHLELVASKTRNDLILRRLPHTETASDAASQERKSEEVVVNLGCAAVETRCVEKASQLSSHDKVDCCCDADVRSAASGTASTAAESSDLALEIARLREENAQLRIRNETLESMREDNLESSSQRERVCDDMPDVFDDPFEPPPQKVGFAAMKHVPSLSTLNPDDFDFSLSNTGCSTPMSTSMHTAVTLNGQVCTIVGIPAGIVERFRAQILSVAGPNPAPPPMWPYRDRHY